MQASIFILRHTDRSSPRTTIEEEVSIKLVRVVKDRSLKGRYRDTSYPSNNVPFYLYGAPNDLNIDHILVRSPNIQLSADNIELSLSQKLSAAVLAKGAILVIHGISEAAMQPFQSTEGPLGDTLAPDSNFFFRPGQEFHVGVYEDPKDAVCGHCFIILDLNYDWLTIEPF